MDASRRAPRLGPASLGLAALLVQAAHAAHAAPEPAGAKARGLILEGQPLKAPEPPRAPVRPLVLAEEVPAVARLPQSTPALRHAVGRYARRVAVTIGINAYAARSGVPALRSAVSDARHMAALFQAMGFDRVEQLNDQEATRENIFDLLERRVPLWVAEQDLVVVFFAGHGATVAGEGYLIPVDSTAQVQRSGISVQRLKESALRMKARHVLFVADACFSGTFLRRGEAPAKHNTLAFWESVAQDRAVQILTAGTANQTVAELQGWGLFTRSLYQGLLGAADQDRDGVVSVPELASHVQSQRGPVAHNSRGEEIVQTPQWGSMEGAGVILLWDARRLPAALTARSPAGRALLPGLETPLRRCHQALERREYALAERLLRELMVEHGEAELNLLLAEIYLAADALGNSALIEQELRTAEGKELAVEQQRRLLELRAQLERARRGAL